MTPTILAHSGVSGVPDYDERGPVVITWFMYDKSQRYEIFIFYARGCDDVQSQCLIILTESRVESHVTLKVGPLHLRSKTKFTHELSH